MIFGKTKLELKVGIFVFGALVILVVFILLIGNFRTWTSGYRASVVFDFVNGVKVGAPVRFSGVDVGEVKKLSFIFDPQQNKTRVNIVCWMRKDAKIPLDSTVWVNTLGLLGEKYIEIMPGKDYSGLFGPGKTIVGQEPIAMHEVTQLAKNIATDVNQGLKRINNKEGTLGKLIYDDTLYNEMAGIFKYKEGTIGKLIYSDELYRDLEALILDIKKHPWKLFKVTKD
jgi:phospholipid/cholesterol/gamma-HCH transport system substrate-binding protein